MTALSLGSQIPSNIVTLEQAVLWSGLSANFVNPTLSLLETPSNPQKRVQVQLFQAADNLTYALVRATIELDPTYVSDRSKKLWMFAREVSNTALPAAFSSN